MTRARELMTINLAQQGLIEPPLAGRLMLSLSSSLLIATVVNCGAPLRGGPCARVHTHPPPPSRRSLACLPARPPTRTEFATEAKPCAYDLLKKAAPGTGIKTGAEMCAMYADMASRYPIVSIEE